MGTGLDESSAHGQNLSKDHVSSNAFFFHRPVDTGRGVDPLGRKSKGSVHVTLSPHPIGQASNQIGISETNFANSNHCVPFCYRYERSTRMSCVRSEFIGHSEAEWMPIEWLQLESKHKHRP